MNNQTAAVYYVFITLRTKPSGAVYWYRSCVCVCVCNGWVGGQSGGVCYHDNSKLRVLIFTKLGL